MEERDGEAGQIGNCVTENLLSLLGWFVTPNPRHHFKSGKELPFQVLTKAS